MSAGALAFLQGVTEFLPISSSAHLIIFPSLFGWHDQGLAFDIAVHVGTLVASVLYFRRDITEISLSWFQSLVTRKQTEASHLGWFIIVASLPAAVIGYLAFNLVQTELRSTAVIATTTLVFALALWYADQFRRGSRTLKSMGISDALVIGLFQAIAIIPGTSRSGITMTAALMLGFSRKEAAKFAFLLAIPTIAMAGGWQFFKLTRLEVQADWFLFGFATAVAGIVAWLCIHYFLRFIEVMGMLPFVIYRICLALFLFVWF